MTDSDDDLRKLLEREIPRGVAAWRKLPELLESGWLTKGSGNWYRIKNARVMNEVSCIAKGFRIDKAGQLTHIQLSKPSKKLIEFADRIAARDKAASRT